MSTVTQALAEILTRPLSARARERAALLLLDWTGCVLAGRREAAGEKMAAAFTKDAGPCTRIGASSGSALMAALHNGCLGNILEMDDVDRQAILHVAPSVMPAALAATEQVGGTAETFLDAIVMGYEATIRIGRAVGPGHYALWHNTATCGPFETRHEADSMAKHLHCSHAAHAGLLSAMLSVQGFQGPRSILEGEQGFFKALCPGADPQAVLVEPGADWRIHAMSLKPYPACRHAHPVIDATLKIRDGIDPDAVQGLCIETYSDALKFCDRPEPETAIEAKFSLQHCTAVTLLRGVPQLADFEPDVIQDPAITALRAKVSVTASAEFNGRYPDHFGAKVTCGSASASVKDAYGDPENPMSEAAVIDKAKTLMRHGGLSANRADRLCAATLALAQGGTVQAYIEALS